MKIPVLFTFFANLFLVLYKVPRAVMILKIVMDIVGSESVQAILVMIQEVAQKIRLDDKPADSLPPALRKRFGERLKRQLGQRLLGLNDQQLTQTLQAFGKEPIA